MVNQLINNRRNKYKFTLWKCWAPLIHHKGDVHVNKLLDRKSTQDVYGKIKFPMVHFLVYTAIVLCRKLGLVIGLEYPQNDLVKLCRSSFIEIDIWNLKNVPTTIPEANPAWGFLGHGLNDIFFLFRLLFCVLIWRSCWSSNQQCKFFLCNIYLYFCTLGRQNLMMEMIPWLQQSQHYIYISTSKIVFVFVFPYGAIF